MNCEQCGKELYAKQRRFCSFPCHHQSMRTIDLEKLQPLVEQGIGKSEIARRLGVYRFKVRRAIAGYGLERLWRERRYA
jgi:hypothetical protein